MSNASLIVESPLNDGDLWIECRTCGRANYLSKGPIGHKRGCSTGAQYSAIETAASPVATCSTDSELRAFASNVRAYSQTKGRDNDVFTAVRAGYLSESDAMNTDD
jgi:hypothetical protein